jgi:O-antigen ligase
VYGRAQLFSIAALILTAVSVAWLLRGGYLRRGGRMWLVLLAVVAALAVLARRVGWGELAVLAVLALLPVFVLPARRSPPG